MLVHWIKSIIVLFTVILFLKFELTLARRTRDLPENWKGRWFPQDPSKTIDDNPTVEYYGGGDQSNLKNQQHEKHGIPMGIPNADCDDGKTNLTMDWDNSPEDYLCFNPQSRFLPNVDVHPLLHVDHIPVYYTALHSCMNESIIYKDDIPTFGTHRPLWAKYGEYLYLPQQRWIHDLEHGAIVMLYHPCSNNLEVKYLKQIVRGCLYRHIITPSRSVTEERPLALVAWGARLEMSQVDENVVITFIKQFALRGPEQLSKNGQFEDKLLIPAKIVSNQDDVDLCPVLF